MLRYRDSLGLLPATREQHSRRRTEPGGAASRPAVPAATPHRQFSEGDLNAAALALAIERRYDITPAALAFGLRVLAEPAVRADVAELSRRIGRVQPAAVRALDFEQERALRLLNMSGRAPGRGTANPGRSSRPR
jgi:MerR family transcriptional regulator, copper efflux regulator